MTTDVLSTLSRGHKPIDVDKSDGPKWDYWLLLIVFCLIGFGLVMLYSSSAVMASQRFGDNFFLVKSQAQKVVLGTGLLIVGLRIDYRWYKRLIYPILITTIVVLILVLIPGIGMVQNGARRWFSLAGFSLQPAEIAKLVAVMFMAYSVNKKGKRMGSFTVGFIPHLVIIGFLAGLLLLQPDFGSAVILGTMMMILLFISGARITYLFGVTILGFAGAYFAISGSEYRMKRILAFLDPWSHRQDIGYQISESLIAVGSSGLMGRGLGNGTGKLGYVPELWNDFIGTIIAEELGIWGIIFLVALFLAIIWRGMRIAFRSDDKFGVYLASGITAMFALQGAANLFVVTGMLPTKGLTLPFVSFGGTSMIMALFAVGILLNISKNKPDYWELQRDDRERKKQQTRWDKKRKRILKNRDQRI